MTDRGEAHRTWRRVWNLSPPDSHRLLRVGSAFAVAAAGAAEPVRRALEQAGTLFGYAAAHPRAERLEGRGPLYAVPADGERWVVRHYRRGGAVARWLGDRYLRLGTPRPLRELRASLELTRRGIATPAVAAIVLYPAGVLYRADIATVRVAGASDLAEILFRPGETPGEDRLLACLAAGDLLRRLAERGVIHADLNAKNILLQWTERPPRVHLLDLDRCRFVARGSPVQRERMRRRLLRSLRKWEAKSGRRLQAREWEALERAG